MQEIKPEDYYGQKREEMLDFIPNQAGRILDAGCGSGLFAGFVKSKTGAEAWGIELNPLAAAMAEKKLDHVLNGNLNIVLPRLPDKFFDVIIFNDVLEHLEDPCSALENCRRLLTDNGCIVCSIPNVRYITNLYNLLIKREWKYEESGILDRTHLRFFTKKSIAGMFVRLGYRIVRLEGINPIRHPLFPFVNILSCGLLSDARFLQYAVVVKAGA